MSLLKYGQKETSCKLYFFVYSIFPRDTAFSHRLQYSVFKIKNSRRILNNITAEIQGIFAKKFKETDSVMIFSLSKQCKIFSYGYAKNEEKEFMLIL